MGEMHLREGVRQGRVRAASTGKAGRVVVATDDHRRHPVVPDPRQGALDNAERTVVRGRVVEDVAEPYQQVGLLRQGKLYGGLEGPLEVPFPLVDPTFDRVREVGAPEVGVADRSNLHSDQTFIVTRPSS